MRRFVSKMYHRVIVGCLSSMLIVLCGCGGGGSTSTFPTGSFQLSVQTAGGGGGTISSTPAGIDCGKACTANFTSGTQVTLTASPAANSFFAGWSGDCSGTGMCKVTLTGNTSVMANFSDLPVLGVTLAGTGKGSVASNPAGINCGQTCSASFAPGTQVLLTATAATNSYFVGWTGGGCSGSSPTCTVTLSQSEQVTATFGVPQVEPVLSVSLAGTGAGTVSSNPAGISCKPTCSASFNEGTQVTLTETPGTNSYFVGWVGGGCSGSNPTCTVTLSQSQQVTATFDIPQVEPVLTVTLAGTGTGSVTSNPAGISCAPTCNASFPSGTQVTLTETPGTNSSFAGWGGACSSSGTNPTCTVTLSASQQATATFNVIQVVPVLTVTLAGTGTGSVTSNPAGINCPATCSASFSLGTQVTLTETPGTNSYFAGWGGACSGDNSTCTLTLTASQQVGATFTLSQGVNVLNHIVFLAQENRSFDHYFGALREYWAQNGYPDQSFDGLPQFNPTSGQPPLYGPPPSLPGCDPKSPPPNDCVFDPNNPVTSYHLITQCIENPSPSWNESHVDWDYKDPVGNLPATLDGVVWTAGHDARADKFYDVDGIRAMGYYDGGDLNYYYFMASNFATSDRWFNPAMTRTHPNREYLIAGTSQGYAYPVGTDSHDKALLTATTIFQELQAANISWKIYVDPTGSNCSGPPYDPACLLTLSYVQFFQWGQTIPTQYPNNIAPISQYFADLEAGTLPQVAQIEPATDAGYDEHPSVSDSEPNNIQKGATYVSSLINGLMTSNSWKDSAFILTFDEFGGLYDHVSPQPAVSPDGIKPVDLLPGDICTKTTGPICDFVYTGYRVPLVVVSPYTRKNYVSHTVADLTAILKLIETRFNLQSLTNRDAAQMDMTEFFDFDNPVWMTPPSPPAQDTGGACYLNKLP
jgi:phospholipase C